MTREQAIEIRGALADLISAIDSAERASAAREALPAGSTRARVTTANAKWSNAARYRDGMEARFRAMVEAAP